MNYFRYYPNSKNKHMGMLKPNSLYTAKEVISTVKKKTYKMRKNYLQAVSDEKLISKVYNIRNSTQSKKTRLLT